MAAAVTEPLSGSDSILPYNKPDGGVRMTAKKKGDKWILNGEKRYSRKFALGSVAGSACLGMLISPSVLLIIWGIVTEILIGFLFLTGILLGLILSLLMAFYCSGTAIIKPQWAPAVDLSNKNLTTQEMISGGGVIFLIIAVLGSIWVGLATSSEAAALGAFFGLLLAIIKGVRWDGIREAIIDSGKVIAPILFLLLTAQMYSRLLTTGGIVNLITDTVGGGHRPECRHRDYDRDLADPRNPARFGLDHSAHRADLLAYCTAIWLQRIRFCHHRHPGNRGGSSNPAGGAVGVRGEGICTR